MNQYACPYAARNTNGISDSDACNERKRSLNEISVKVDDDPRAVYFDQVRNGRFVRMALITTLLNQQ